MKIYFITISIVLMATVASAQAIRDFDLRTIESLGKRIIEQDMIVAEATDILFSQGFDLSQYPMRGWIFEHIGNESFVTFIAEYDGMFFGVFEVRKKGRRKGEFKELDRVELDKTKLTRFKARSLALRSIDSPCSDRYNFVILNDIDEDGYLVYALAATTDPDAIMVGGHYRFTISSDGETIDQKDKLFLLALRMAGCGIYIEARFRRLKKDNQTLKSMRTATPFSTLDSFLFQNVFLHVIIV